MSLPKILDTGFKIDEPKLWAIDIPVEEIPITDIEYNLDIPYLDKEGTDDWNLTPRMLIENLDQEPSHAKDIDATDLKYPIDLYFHDGKWIILDGVHRFAKAIILGHQTIKIRRVSENIVLRVKRKRDLSPSRQIPNKNDS